MSAVQVTGSAEYGIPVHGRELGWAKSALQQNGVPIVQIVALGNGAYLITVVMPVGAPPPDWRGMPTYKRAPWYRRMDIGAWVPRLLILAALAAVGWLLVNGAPMAVASLLPGAGEPLVNVLPDAGGIVDDLLAPVGEAVDAATRIGMGVLALAVGLVVLWLLWTFRGTLGGIAGMLRRGK